MKPPSPPADRSPLLVLGLSAALLAFGYGRRDPHGDAPPPRADLAPSTQRRPKRGAWAVLKGVYRRFTEDRVTSIAGGVTFFALLALFPAIAALVSIYGLFTDPRQLTGQIDALSNVLPGGAIEVVGGQLQRLAEQGRSSLGIAFLISVGAALWSANAGMKAIFDALNIVYDEDEKRSFLKLNIQSLAFTLAGLVFILAALAAVIVVPVLFGYLGLDDAGATAVRLGRWPLLLLALAFALAVVYRFGPSRRTARWRWISWGSAVASLAWLAASVLFSWYAANFGSFNQTYGTLGAAIGFMTWIWISSIVILVGAELDAELECQDPAVPRKRPEGGLGRAASGASG
ncbi:YihY/virulence factor BrkB family protein [Rhodoplanes sp. TEM]|uniref:YihY/virulence factor BrkB family protein n=1 Tax=Rhodoplanes tepidamans TaxID=200616 RepID=A0ABT5JAK9_RHOTP|nr:MULTISPECIES: YihY/virulence factor BrkB family protein [Rhodoplanes]MDC7786677.1 YihY/virulence factor BrkB family protein [Rhodoplanes tepidamans]MDC7982976.1 YihY/virulence factor BrkB family protein [Rhodoplanes sp. TEM]MDQ0356358.1 membrane protein [Rhodoplanes tepidamans]